MALEARRIQKVPTSETTACHFCGARYGDEVGLEFVSFDNRPYGASVPEEVDGKIETVGEKAGKLEVQVRDGLGGRERVVREIDLPMVCSNCLTTAVRLLGWEDAWPLQAALAERDEQLADARDWLVQSEQEKDEANAALRDAEVRLRPFAAEETNAGARKRTPARKAA